MDYLQIALLDKYTPFVFLQNATTYFHRHKFVRDYEFGHSLAQWVRERGGIVGPTGRAEPEQALGLWNVTIADIELPTPAIDAVAAWGRSIGPVVLVNPRGRRAHDAAGRRAVLAHEICHLLIDRKRALPAAEVLGGRVSQPPAARAAPTDRGARGSCSGSRSGSGWWCRTGGARPCSPRVR
jgi:hypothetical protein